MQRAAEQNKKSKIFFANLSGITAFFSKSPKRLCAFDEAVQKRIPRPSSTRWNFNSRTVKVVHEHIEDLKECFNVLKNCETLSHSTIQSSIGFEKILRSDDFLYFLNLFQKIMPHVDILYNQLQSSRYCRQCLC